MGISKYIAKYPEADRLYSRNAMNREHSNEAIEVKDIESADDISNNAEIDTDNDFGIDEQITMKKVKEYFRIRSDKNIGTMEIINYEPGEVTAKITFDDGSVTTYSEFNGRIFEFNNNMDVPDNIKVKCIDEANEFAIHERLAIDRIEFKHSFKTGFGAFDTYRAEIHFTDGRAASYFQCGNEVRINMIYNPILNDLETWLGLN